MDILSILNRVEVLLKESGHSKSELYAACSVSASAISQWKSGRTSPATKSLQNIADYLNVTYEYLISGVGSKEKAPIPEDEREIVNPDIRMIARAGQKMTPEQAENLRKYAQFMYPEAFNDNK